MPHGKYVAFDAKSNTVHACDKKSSVGTSGWTPISRRSVVSEPWLAFTQSTGPNTSTPVPDTLLNAVVPRKDYSMSRLAQHALAQPAVEVVQPAKTSLDDWKSHRRQRVTALLADLPLHDITPSGRDAKPGRNLVAAETTSFVVPLAEQVIRNLDVFRMLDDLDAALDFHTGDLQALVDDVTDGWELDLAAGVARGTVIVDAALEIRCAGEPGVHVLGGEQPAIIINAPGDIVTLRSFTFNADCRYGTVLVIDGHLRLEHCVIGGRVAIVLGPNAGNVEIVDSRIVCPTGGCGVVSATDAAITFERVWIGVHNGIGILDLGGVEAGIDTTTVTVVGDHTVKLHVAEFAS